MLDRVLNRCLLSFDKSICFLKSIQQLSLSTVKLKSQQWCSGTTSAVNSTVNDSVKSCIPTVYFYWGFMFSFLHVHKQPSADVLQSRCFWKHLCWSLCWSNKLTGEIILLTTESNTAVPVNIGKHLRTPFYRTPLGASSGCIRLKLLSEINIHK